MLEKLWARYSVLFSMVIVVGVGLVVFVLFWPHSKATVGPRGRILVGSPEVYTRERLVNDRAEQEAWLRVRLKEADTLQFGLSGKLGVQQRKVARLSGAVGSAVPAASGSAPPTAPNTDASGLTDMPLDLFRERAAYRDVLRSEMIENQLDDRHDLDGNTLYRLNFDVTTIPSMHNQAYAVVEVIVSGDQRDKGNDNTADRQFFADWLRNLLSDARATFRKRAQDAWTAFVAARSEATANAKPPAAPPTAEVQEDLAAVDLRRKEVEKHKPGAAPRAPGRVAEMTESEFRKALASVFVERMNQHYGALVAFRESEGDITLDNLPGATSEANKWKFNDSYYAYQALVREVSTVYAYAVVPNESFDRLGAHSAESTSLTSSLAAAPPAGTAVQASSALEAEAARETTAAAIERNPYIIGFTGIRPRPVFDKKSPSAALSAANALAPPSASGSPGIATQSRKTTAPDAEDGAHFGWLIGPRFRATAGPNGAAGFEQSLSHNTLSAIISLPAWWTWVHLAVITYWYDAADDSYYNEAGERIGHVVLYGWRHNTGLTIRDLDIGLPLDPRPLSDVFFNDDSGRATADALKQPAIDKDKMQPVRVVVDTDTDIVIPGRNLWRSPLVTLGSQQASNIQLLPNMNGLVAHFSKVAAPPGWEGKGTNDDLVLTVWTSQKNSDSVSKKVIIYPAMSSASAVAQPPQPAPQTPAVNPTAPARGGT